MIMLHYYIGFGFLKHRNYIFKKFKLCWIIFFTSFCFFILIYGCNSKPHSKNRTEILRYFSEIHLFKPDKPSIYCIIDISVDCSCLDLLLNELIILPDCENLSLIWIGNTVDSITSKKIELINAKFKYYSDFGKRIYLYETGFYKPLICYFKPNDSLPIVRTILDQFLSDEIKLLMRECKK